MRWVWSDLMNAFRSMSGAKSRTALATLGIVIGVMSVLAVSSIGASAQQLIVGQVTSAGGDLVGIIPGGSQDDGPPPIAFGIITTTLTRGDVDALSRLSGIQAISAYVRATKTVSYLGDGIVASVNGVEPAYLEVEDVEVGEGRFFDQGEVENFARVAVVGPEIRRKLTPPDGSLIGDRIRVGETAFTVIGEIAERGSSFFQNQDEVVFVPVTTAQRLIQGQAHIDYARAKSDGTLSLEALKDAIRVELRMLHGIDDPSKDDFSVRSTDQAVAILGGITGAIKAFLIAVTAVSLLVGGVNVMNVMYIAVKERTREIGLRKALGASSRRILAQFLVESAVMSSIGGFVGASLGAALTWGVALAVNTTGYDWEFILPASLLFQAVLIATIVGIVFGVSPAFAAAKKDPIAAIRDE
jgi:putative ABC transport system permease protein